MAWPKDIFKRKKHRMPLSPVSCPPHLTVTLAGLPFSGFLSLAIGIGHYLPSNYLLRNSRLLKGGQRFQPLSHYAKRVYIAVFWKYIRRGRGLHIIFGPTREQNQQRTRRTQGKKPRLKGKQAAKGAGQNPSVRAKSGARKKNMGIGNMWLGAGEEGIGLVCAISAINFYLSCHFRHSASGLLLSQLSTAQVTL